MERGQIVSLLKRINKGDLQEVAQEIIGNWANLRDELFEPLKKQVRGGSLLDTVTLGKLVILSKDRDFYQINAVRSAVLGSRDFLLDALRAGIPDREIERRMCKDLALQFDTNSYVGRRTFLEALEEHGSIECLDSLLALEYEFGAQYQTAKIKLGLDYLRNENDMEQFLDLKPTEADVLIGLALKKAIAAVRDRSSPCKDSWSEEIMAKNLFSDSRAIIAKAQNSVDSDLDGALNKLRQATESMLKEVITRMGFEPRNKGPIDKMQLPELIPCLMELLKDSHVEHKDIHKRLEQIRNNSTWGSHNQGVGIPVTDFASPTTVKGDIETFLIVARHLEEFIESYGGLSV